MLPQTSAMLLADPDFVPSPCYWIPEVEVIAGLHGDVTKKWLIASRRITSAGLQRTCIYAFIPLVGASDSITLADLPRASPRVQKAFVANMNSFVFDFVTRQKQAGANLSFFVKRQLPLVRAATYAERTEWDATQPLDGWISPRVLELTYTAWDLEAFARDCNFNGPPFRWDEERRFLLRCELDAAFFHLYLPADTSGDWRQTDGETPEELIQLKSNFSTPRDAVAYVMDTFRVVRDNDEQQFNGDYRTKRVILEIYDALQDAIQTGRPYQTRLDPPPGPPIDASGKFVSYAEIAANPPPHIHLPQDHSNAGAELHLSDLARGFPDAPFIVRLGAQASARRIRVIPVSTAELRVGERVILTAPALHVHGHAAPAAIGKLGIESRLDASSDEHYVLVSVRGDEGVAQARLSEAEWKSLTSVGRVKDLG